MALRSRANDQQLFRFMLYYAIWDEDAYTNTKVVKMCPFGASNVTSSDAEAAHQGSPRIRSGFLRRTIYRLPLAWVAISSIYAASQMSFRVLFPF